MRGTVPYPSAIIENLFQASLALCHSLRKKIVRQWTNYFTKNVIEWKINNPKTNVSHLLISHSFPTKIYAVLWDFFLFFLYVSKILHHHSSLYLFPLKVSLWIIGTQWESTSRNQKSWQNQKVSINSSLVIISFISSPQESHIKSLFLSLFLFLFFP